jgi:DNA-binding CsgD family transcriptional regulator
MSGANPQVIGRRGELAEVLGWLRSARPTGTGAALVVEGEPGIGKTALLAEAARRAREDGRAVRWLRAHADLGTAPFFLWRSLLPAGSAPDPGGVANGPDAPDRPALFESVVSTLRDEGDGLLLVIDDAQWADDDSLDLLRYAIRELHRLPISVLMGSRTIDPRPSTAWDRTFAAVAREPTVEHLVVSGLDPQATRELFEQLAGSTIDPSLAGEIQAMTLGNPLFVRELARSFRATGELARSVTIGTIIATNLTRLGPHATASVQVAGLLGERFRSATVASVIDEPAPRVASDLEEAARAGIVAPTDDPAVWTFTHALNRDACVRSIEPDQLASIHARVAMALESEPEIAAAEIARHHLAARTLDPEAAARWTARAGREAMAAFAFDEAAGWFARSIGCGGSDDDVAELAVEQVAAWWAIGRRDPCREALNRAVEHACRAGRPDLEARAVLIAEPVGVMAWDLWIAQCCDNALASIDASEPELRAQLLARRAEALLYAGDYDTAAITADEALAAADACGTAPAVVAALRARQVVASAPEHHDERVQLADRMIGTGVALRRPDVELWGRLWRIDTHWERGHVAAVAEDLPRLRWCSEQIGDHRARWHLLITRAALEAGQARFDDATRTAAEAFELSLRGDLADGLGAYMNLLGVVGHHIGHDAAMGTMPDGLDGAEPADAGELRDSIFSYLGPAVALAEDGHLDAALDLYRRAGPPSTWRPPPYLRVPAWANGVLAAIALRLDDDVAALRRRLDDERGHSVVVGAGVAAYGGPVELYLGKAAAHLGDLDRAVQDLESALEAVVAGGSPAFEAEVCLELSDALRRRAQGGDTVRALELAERGAHLARRLAMAPWRARADALLEQLAVPDQLTRREREVANLVAEGMTNRQIAEALFISERTAQTHVQHILTKLGFSARAQIATWVTAAPQARQRVDQ